MGDSKGSTGRNVIKDRSRRMGGVMESSGFEEMSALKWRASMCENDAFRHTELLWHLTHMVTHKATETLT